VSRAGSVLFSASVDHVGPLARTVGDLATVFDAIQGPDTADQSCSDRAASSVSPSLGRGIGDLRIALADGYFLEAAEAETIAAVVKIADAVGVSRKVEVPHAAAGRAVATIVTAVEGASKHLNNLRIRPGDFDPMSRDRFIAGALLPGSVYSRAQARRSVYRDAVRALFYDVDVLIAPVTPAAAPLIGQDLVTIDGITYPSRGHIGRFTIPFSIAGLPAMSVPAHVSGLPRGVQLIAAPFKEEHLFRLAAHLERLGVVGFTRPQ
jgi:Asp-tRNA(Asn)/Glu-tRNA(Gln) amidotransferase A subunit family amidase